MGRGPAEDRQRRRALEAVETAILRKQVEPALEAFLKLDGASRNPVLPAVARLYHDEIRRAFRAGEWARLQFLAARADRERRLLSAEVKSSLAAGPRGGPDAATSDENEARWALFWGAALSKDWTRARLHLQALASLLGTAPALHGALEAFVAASGQPPVDAYLGLSEATPPAPADPRLGFERRQKSAVAARSPSLPAPARLEDVEPRLLSLHASRSWPAFAAGVLEWVKGAPPAVAERIWIASAQLSVGELLARLPQGERHAAEPALFITRAGRETGAPASLAPEILFALKVATGLFTHDEGASREAALVYAPIAELAARYPDFLALVVDTVAGTLCTAEARLPVLGLVEKLIDRAPSAPLVAKGLGLLSLDPNELAAPGPAPAWLAIALERILGDEAALGSALRDLPAKRRVPVLALLAQGMPIALAERAFDQLWRGGDQPLRRELANTFMLLLDRARVEARPVPSQSREPKGARRIEAMLARMAEAAGLDLGSPGSRSELKRVLDGPMGRALKREMAELDDDDDIVGDEPLPGGALPLWRRFSDRLLPYNIRFLDTALINAEPAVDADWLVAQYFAGRDTVVERVRAVRTAMEAGCYRASAAIEDRLLVGHLRDRDGLAEGLLGAKKLGAPRMFLTRLARALVDADAVAGDPRSPAVEAALLEARLLEPRKKRGRAEKRKPNAKGKAAKASPAKKNGDAAQSHLDFSSVPDIPVVGEAPATRIGHRRESEKRARGPRMNGTPIAVGVAKE